MHKKGRIYRICLSTPGLAVGLLLALTAWWWNCLPADLFPAPLATEVLDREGLLLSAHIAADGQWRMPATDSVPPVLEAAVLAFEDRRFYRHVGMDARSLLRALRDNITAGRVVSGGSTLTMQVARMCRGAGDRNVFQKIIEAAMALRLEVRYTKAELLRLWLDNAPFGGNTVGLTAACYRYYGRPPATLSAAEAATLAVLPNSPALIHPGRNRDALRAKRDRLLRQLAVNGTLTSRALDLALLEPLPGAPLSLPRHAPHYLQRRIAEGARGRVPTTLDGSLQRAVAGVIDRHHRQLRQNQIHNMAVLVTDVRSGEVVAYHGNVPGLASEYAPAVDLVTAPRSPGSLLKPILYGLALDAGELLPKQMLADVPTSFQNFRPANFHPEFDGAVAADEALVRSLNIPFVYLLRDYGVARFHDRLQRAGFAHMQQTSGHYGLSLILGGAEITLEEIHHWFLGLAQQQLTYHARRQASTPTDYAGLGAGAGFTVLETLRDLRRPDGAGDYHRFESHRPVAWKTGTSFGFRDAWAVGATPSYVVSVWVGNADGAGRPGLIGVQAAAPVLFDVFRLLEDYDRDGPRWFTPPDDALRTVATCTVSGYLASLDCPVSDHRTPRVHDRTLPCPFHHRVLLTSDGAYRTTSQCSPNGVLTNLFTLPPLRAHFYRRRHADYQDLPAWQKGCRTQRGREHGIQFIYPEGSGVLSAVKNWQGELEPFFFAVSTADPASELFWHLDGQYLRSTKLYHQLSLPLAPGPHQLTVTDGSGNNINRYFVVH